MRRQLRRVGGWGLWLGPMRGFFGPIQRLYPYGDNWAESWRRVIWRVFRRTDRLEEDSE